MSSLDILIIAIMGLAGYWVVSFLMGDRTPKTKRDAPKADQPHAKEEPSRTHHTREESVFAEGRGNVPWYEVLEVPPIATPTMIRSAYRKLMSQYHPDKVASLGPELKALAERKTRDIRRAYETGMVLRGDKA